MTRPTPEPVISAGFLIEIGQMAQAAEAEILDVWLNGLEPNDEWRRMAHEAASAAVRVAVQRGWRPKR